MAVDGNIHSQWYGMVRKRDDEIFDLKGKVESLEKTIEILKKENKSLKDDLREKKARFCRTQERLRKYEYEERLRISRERRAIRMREEEEINRKVRIEEEERERVREELHAKKKKQCWRGRRGKK